MQASGLNHFKSSSDMSLEDVYKIHFISIAGGTALCPNLETKFITYCVGRNRRLLSTIEINGDDMSR